MQTGYRTKSILCMPIYIRGRYHLLLLYKISISLYFKTTTLQKFISDYINSLNTYFIPKW